MYQSHTAYVGYLLGAGAHLRSNELPH